MPIFTFYTNVARRRVSMEVLKTVSKMLSETLSKTEDKFSITIVPEQLMFTCKSDTPCGQGTLVSLGTPNKIVNGKAVAQLSELFEKELGIPKARCAIRFVSPKPEDIGKNGVLLE